MFTDRPPFTQYPGDIRQVAGAKKSMDEAATEEPREADREVQEYAEKAQRMLDSYKRFFETFAKDSPSIWNQGM